MTHNNDTKPTTSHFPEPWTYDFSPYGIVDILATDPTGEFPQSRYVAEIDADDVGRFVSHQQHEANARRICAAVNACEGISTEALEQGVVAELLEKIQAVAELRRKWRSQDEAETIDSIEYMDGLDALDLDAVIAKATGRAA